MTPTYTVEAWLEDDWWVAQVVDASPGANPAVLDRATQATTLVGIEPMARDLIATVLGVEEDTFTVRMQFLGQPPPRTQG